jgi:hypothetical protein
MSAPRIRRHDRLRSINAAERCGRLDVGTGPVANETVSCAWSDICSVAAQTASEIAEFCSLTSTIDSIDSLTLPAARAILTAAPSI